MLQIPVQLPQQLSKLPCFTLAYMTRQNMQNASTGLFTVCIYVYTLCIPRQGHHLAGIQPKDLDWANHILQWLWQLTSTLTRSQRNMQYLTIKVLKRGIVPAARAVRLQIWKRLVAANRHQGLHYSHSQSSLRSYNELLYSHYMLHVILHGLLFIKVCVFYSFTVQYFNVEVVYINTLCFWQLHCQEMHEDGG